MLNMKVIMCMISLAVIEIQARAAIESPVEVKATDTNTSTAQPNLRDVVREQLISLKNYCKQKAHITPDEAKIFGSHEPTTTIEQNCYLECIYNNLGITKNGKFAAEELKKLAQLYFKSLEKVKEAYKLIDTCSKEAEKTDHSQKCNIGGIVHNCLAKYGSKINLVPMDEELNKV